MKTLIKITSAAFLAAGIIFSMQSCTESKGNDTPIPKRSEPIPVKVITIEKTTSEPLIHTSGRITTNNETILSFKVAGVVQNVVVNEGDKIKKGQTLATLDLTEINGLVSQAKFGFEKAERDLKRTSNLYQDSVATLEQLQNAQTAYEVAKEQLSTANFNRNFAEIKAQADGHVLRKFVNQGQVVGIGDPVLQTNGSANGQWILKSGVSDMQWTTIKINDKATVKLDAFPGQEFKGVVIRKSGTSDPANGAFTIEVALENRDSRLASGMFASAKINSGLRNKSWKIPYEAVLDAHDDEGFIFITNDDKKAIKVPVVIESFNENHVIVSKGLDEAKAVIVSGSAYLTDHSPITIIK